MDPSPTHNLETDYETDLGTDHERQWRLGTFLDLLEPDKVKIPCIKVLLFFLIVRHPLENAWTLPYSIVDILLVWKKGKYLPRIGFHSHITLTLHWEGWQVSCAVLKLKLFVAEWKWKYKGK